MTEPDWAALDAAWRPARRAGVLGSATTEALIAHAAGYLPAACRVDDEFTGVDLGTGAGVPGVVLAALRPSSSWVLVDANERRCEYAAAAVRALGMSGRVVVRHARVEDVAHDPLHRGAYDLVVARSFGPPGDLAECALPLMHPDGRLGVSVVEETLAQWRSAAPRLGVVVTDGMGPDGSHYLWATAPTVLPSKWPRRSAARRRRPLF
ncbi:MAG: RsmG family class I SAM-dependent methyltransferase [Acidimicrobiales bacterium]